MLFPSGILQRGASAHCGNPALSSATASWVRPPTQPVDDEEPDEERTIPFVEAMVGPVDSLVPPFRPGDVIASKYRVDEVLGCGGMAWVFRATHLELNQKVALKFLRFAATGEAVARFIQEGRAAARVSSEAVTRILDVDRLPGGQPFLVMEYLEGRDLEQVVGDPGPMAVETAVDLAIQACEGLAEVHAAGIVHRDLKPANLFLTRKRNGSIRMKLLDFGISKFAAGAPIVGRESPQTSTKSLMGSPVYMAPEQMQSSKHVDARADIWSLGVILYELLSGSSPFQGATLPEVCIRVMRETPERLDTLRSDLPEGLVDVVSRCLEKDPSRRFSSAASVAIALGPYASSDGNRLALRMQRRPSGAPPAPRETGTLASSLPPSGASLPPLASPSVPPVGSSNAWPALALSALLVGVSAASFAAGVRMSLGSGAASATTAPAPPGSMGVTSRMPPTPPRLPSPATLAALPEPTEHVYTPEELPPAPRQPRARRPLASP